MNQNTEVARIKGTGRLLFRTYQDLNARSYFDVVHVGDLIVILYQVIDDNYTNMMCLFRGVVSWMTMPKDERYSLLEAVNADC